MGFIHKVQGSSGFEPLAAAKLSTLQDTCSSSPLCYPPRIYESE